MSNLFTIEDINISNYFLTDNCMFLITRLLRDPKCKIKKLDISINYISHLGIKILADALENNTSLLELNLSENKLIGSQGINYLGKMLKVNKTLQTLVLSSTNCIIAEIGEFAEGIAQNTTLLRLIIGSNNCYVFTGADPTFNVIDDLEKVFSNITSSKSILELGLSKINLDHFILDQIFNELEKNYIIEKIDISYNKIDNYEYCTVCEGLTRNTSIKFINLKNNYIEDKDDEEVINEADYIDYFTQLMIQNNTLQSINLCCNDLTEAVFEKFKHITINESLVVFEVDDDIIIPPVFANMLYQNNILFWTPLRFQNNLFNNEMHKIVMTTLVCNETFRIRIPVHILIDIFGFFQRCNFLNY